MSVRSAVNFPTVIPANAGTQRLALEWTRVAHEQSRWVSAFAGMTVNRMASAEGRP
jgi:hypothetical protein